MKQKTLKLTAAGLLLTLMAGCAGVGQNSNSVFNNSLNSTDNFSANAAKAAAAKADPRALADVKTWAMPSTSDINALAAMPGDLLIVMPPVDKNGALSWTDRQTAMLKPVKNGDNATTRRVLAILTISQTPANPKDIPGDKNGFWTADNQKTVTAKLDKLAALGFDGVALDGVSDYAKYGKERPTAASDMATFVQSLGAHVRQKHKTFILLTRGGAGLPLTLAEKARADYWNAIDSIVVENTFYVGEKSFDNELNPQAETITALDAFQKAHKPVFALDALRDEKKLADFAARATARGWIVPSPPPSVAQAAETLAAPPAETPTH